MEKFDLVLPVSKEFQLASGAQRYSHAVVLSVVPFVLASEHGDMRWESTVDPKNFKVAGKASDKVVKQCVKRTYR